MQRSVDTAGAGAGSEALITYRLAQHLAGLPGKEHLVPVVADIRRTLEIVPRFRARRAAKKDGAEPAASSPAPATPATYALT
jgi:hypothetical protein